jgi:hypothetical protein
MIHTLDIAMVHRTGVDAFRFKTHFRNESRLLLLSNCLVS